jgi:hypothetical protein
MKLFDLGNLKKVGFRFEGFTVVMICAVVLIVCSLSTHDLGTPAACVYVVKIREWRNCVSLNSVSHLQDHIYIVTPQKT